MAVIYDIVSLNGDPTQWNYRENFVQEDENQGTAGSFIASETTLVCAGPPILSDQLKVVKIGLCPSIQISSNIPQQRIYELGSMRCHILNGIPVGGFQMSRMVYNGPSLVRALYGAIYDQDGNLTSTALQTAVSGPAKATLQAQWENINLAADKVTGMNNRTPLWFSMWETRLRFPFGVAVYMQDTAGNAVGGMYYEGCKVGSHSIGQSVGQMAFAEGISVMFDRCVPIVRGVGFRA